MRVTVVDYGLGNLFSVKTALEHCGASVEVTDSADAVARAPRLILPGVGAFADGMSGLRQRNLIAPIREYAASGRPFLGICLGMQMMMDCAEEFGLHDGLAVIPGKVVAIPRIGIDGSPHKIPHIGWSDLVAPRIQTDWQDSILDGLRPGAAMYFVHSYMAVPADRSHTLAVCVYSGHPVTAVIRKGSLYGCQFHPEKSGEDGLDLLRRFLATEPLND
jgi:glutamine amidotransferase